MKAADGPVFRVGGWRVDVPLEQISTGGKTVKLERRSMQLLLCLAQHAGEVLSVDQLLDRVWSGVVVTPDSVYQTVASLRRTLGDDAKEPTYITNIPRLGYRLVARVGPWDEVPEVVVQHPPTPRLEPGAETAEASKGSAPRRWAAIGFLAVLILTLAYYLVDRRRLSTLTVSARTSTPVVTATPAISNPIPERSIAVVPFADLSEKKDQDYFADGMTDEIIYRLAKVPDLRVPARTSSFYFKGKATKISDMATQLGVANVLEGSIRRSGNRVRVIAQLVRADNGYQVWSQSYDRDSRDLFAVQDEIAASVAEAMKISLAGATLTRAGSTRNLEAYQLYLQAQSSVTVDTSEGSIKSAQAKLRQAVELDPNFGLAWTLLASMSMALVDNSDLSPAVGYEEARRLARHAIELDQGLAEPHAVLAYVYRTQDWNWTGAQAELHLALRADPSDPVSLMFDGLLAITLGQLDKADRQLRAAVFRDPLFNYANFNWGQVLYLQGKYGEAETAWRRLLDISPGFKWTRPYLAKTLLAQGKAQDALATLQQMSDDDPDALDYLPIMLYANGRRADADVALQTLIAQRAATDAVNIAAAYAYRNDKELALQWFERAYAQRDRGLLEVAGEPLFKSVADDPRFYAVLRSVRLPH
jgi:TolB-like protein/DNA-binding winged helix-turn-helix (wHTH) protein/Tfp pilus assembly protein PilF